MLVTSIFSFSHNVFKSLPFQGCLKSGLCGKGLIDCMMFYSVFNSISVVSQWQLTLLMSFLGFTRTRLALWSVLPKDTLMKHSEDPVRLEPRTHGLHIKYFTTEPCRTLSKTWKPSTSPVLYWQHGSSIFNISSLHKDKMLCLSKLKALSDANWTRHILISFQRLENILGNKTSIFSFPTMFSRALFIRVCCKDRSEKLIQATHNLKLYMLFNSFLVCYGIW